MTNFPNFSADQINELPEAEFINYFLDNARQELSAANVPPRPLESRDRITPGIKAEYNDIQEEIRTRKSQNSGLSTHLLSANILQNRLAGNLHAQWLRYESVEKDVKEMISIFGRKVLIPGLLGKEELEEVAQNYFTKKTFKLDRYDPMSRMRTALDFGIYHSELIGSSREEDMTDEIFPELSNHYSFNTDLGKLLTAVDNFFYITTDTNSNHNLSMQKSRDAWGKFTIEDIMRFNKLLELGVHELRNLCSIQLANHSEHSNDPILSPLNLAQALELVEKSFVDDGGEV